MARYRKNPVEVDAIEFYGANGQELADWCGGIYEHSDEAPMILISTLKGTMSAALGDWIIRGVAGEFYPRKPDIFEQSYEAVAEVTA